MQPTSLTRFFRQPFDSRRTVTRSVCIRPALREADQQKNELLCLSFSRKQWPGARAQTARCGQQLRAEVPLNDARRQRERTGQGTAQSKGRLKGRDIWCRFDRGSFRVDLRYWQPPKPLGFCSCGSWYLWNYLSRFLFFVHSEYIWEGYFSARIKKKKKCWLE